MSSLKNIKKGDKVILRMFTGAFVEAKTVEMADAKKIGFTNKKGEKMVFDKSSGKQITPEPKSEKYANYVDVYDADVEAEELAKRSKKKAAPAKKAAPKAAPKKTTKKAADPEPEEAEEEDLEEADDEDFEEVE